MPVTEKMWNASRTLVIAQSGGPTPVANASIAGALGAARNDDRVGCVLGARFGIEGILHADYIDLTDGPDTEILERTPGAALGSSRYRPSDEEIERAVLDLAGRGSRWLAMVGGNDSAETLHRLHLAAHAAGGPLSVVGIPKTIDNDLPFMDHSPGYGSAARYIALAVREAGLDTAAMQRSDPIKFIEVMGRNAGWLAAAAAIGRDGPADAPQLIFFPERPRAVDQMLAEIRQAWEANGWVVVVLSENQRDHLGRPLGAQTPIYVDPHGHPYYESPGASLARRVQSALGLRARYERPGSLQRTSANAVSTTDMLEAREAGAQAVRLALGGQSDVMVAIQRDERSSYAVTFNAVPLSEIAHRERCLPDGFIAFSGTDVTEEFLAYARPLVGGPLPPVVRLVGRPAAPTS